jgi:hypothetical protein
MQFIKDDLSKESLYNFLLTPEMHPNKDVHRVINDYGPIFIRNMLDINLGI